MAALIFITHPEVTIDPATPVERWRLSDAGVRRMRLFAESGAVKNVASVWASGEAKAIEAAGLLAAGLGVGVKVAHELGENDRRATGFLPPPAFERMADAFFARPDESVRGWERAIDAQSRIRRAVEAVAAAESGAGDVAVVAHGGVGTLLLCALAGRAINRAEDQPFQGCYWTARLPDLAIQHGWRPIAPRG